MVHEPPLTAPVPVSAVFVSDVVLAVTFDKPLAAPPEPLIAGNWVADFGGIVPLAAMVWGASPDQVRLTFGSQPDVETVSYLASPPDVVGANGLDVQAFAEFPITL